MSIEMLCPTCKHPTGGSLLCKNCGAALDLTPVGAETVVMQGAKDISVTEPSETTELLDHLATDHKDRYSTGDSIAEGGMGKVLTAYEKNIRREVAMKVVIRSGQAYDDRVRLARFIEEAQVTGQLEHPNVVPVHELGIDEDGQVFYTMKMIHGVDLERVLSAIRDGDELATRLYPLSKLINIFLKACDAVAFAHSRGVIHRDLKPANIMIGDYGEVLVMDWGVAKIVGQENTELKRDWVAKKVKTVRGDTDVVKTLDGYIIGTPAFMSPEQAEGKHDAMTHVSDIYSLGAILYNILTLRFPIQTDNLTELLSKLGAGKIPPPQSWNTSDDGTILHHCPRNRVPDSLAAVAMKALSLSPKDRYQTVNEMQEDLIAWQQGYATEAEQASVLRQLRLLVVRHKTESMLTVAAMCILMVTVGWFVMRLKQSRDKEQTQRVRAEQLLDDVNREKEKVVAAQQNALNEKDIAERNARQAEQNAAEAKRNAAEAKRNAEEAKRNAEKAKRNAEEAERMARKAEENRKIAEQNRTVAERNRLEAEENARKAERNADEAKQNAKAAEHNAVVAEQNEYVANVALASDQILRSGRPRSGLEILEACPTELRGFEWHFLRKRVLNEALSQPVSAWYREPGLLDEQIRIDEDSVQVLAELPGKRGSAFHYYRRDGEHWREFRAKLSEKITLSRAKPTGDIDLFGAKGGRWTFSPETGTVEKRPRAGQASTPICTECNVGIDHFVSGFVPALSESATLRDLGSNEVLYSTKQRTAYVGLLPHKIILANTLASSAEIQVEVVNCRGELQYKFHEDVPKLGQVLSYHLAPSLDRRMLLIANSGGQLFFLDSQTGKLKRKVTTPFVPFLGLGRHFVALGPAIKKVFFSDNNSGSILYDSQAERVIARYPFAVNVYCSSSDLFAVAEGSRIHIIRWDSGKLWRTISAHERPVAAMQFLPGRRLRSASSGLIVTAGLDDPQQYLWDVHFNYEGHVVGRDDRAIINPLLPGFIHRTRSWLPVTKDLRYFVRKKNDPQSGWLILEMWDGDKFIDSVAAPRSWHRESTSPEEPFPANLVTAVMTGSGRYLLCELLMETKLHIFDRQKRNWSVFEQHYPSRWHFTRWTTSNDHVPTTDGLQPLTKTEAPVLNGLVSDKYIVRILANGNFEVRDLNKLNAIHFQVPSNNVSPDVTGRFAWDETERIGVFAIGHSKVALYDLKAGQHLRTFTGSPGAIVGVGLWPDGSRIMIVDNKNGLYFLDSQSGKELFRASLVAHSGKPLKAIRFIVSPNRRNLLVITPNRGQYLLKAE